MSLCGFVVDGKHDLSVLIVSSNPSTCIPPCKKSRKGVNLAILKKNKCHNDINI